MAITKSYWKPNMDTLVNPDVLACLVWIRIWKSKGKERKLHMDSATLMRLSLNQTLFCDFFLVNIHLQEYKNVGIEQHSIILQMAKKTALETTELKLSIIFRTPFDWKLERIIAAACLGDWSLNPCHAKPIITPKGIITVMPGLELEYVC